MDISASIQAANQLDLLRDIETNANKFDQLHIDITDGHFTDNIGLSLDIVSKLKKNTSYKLDVPVRGERRAPIIASQQSCTR